MNTTNSLRRRNGEMDILIVEDSPTQAQRLKHVLENCGYGVTMAANGASALQRIAERPPILVISDVVMPGMDGYTLCREIKSRDNLKDIPVLLVTSLSSPRDIIRGLQCGANIFIRKPYEERYLLSRIEYAIANLELRKRNSVQLGVELSLGGERHFITAERQQILDLLISTYDEAVRMHEELRVKQEDLLRSYQMLQSLYGIAEVLNQPFSESQMFDAVLERATQLPGVRAGWVVLRGEDSTFHFVASRNLSPALKDSICANVDCLCQRMLLSGELQSATNVSLCERLQRADRRAQGLRCHASIPVRLEGHAVAILNLVGAGEGLFEAQELKLLHTVGQQLSVALERSRLLGQLERKVGERTAALTAEIGERKRVEEELRASEGRYRSLVTATAQIIWATNPDGLVANDIPSWRAYTGQTFEQVKGSGWAQAIHPDDRERALDAWRQAVATRSLYETECRMRARDGAYRAFVVRGVPVVDDAGAVREWVGTCTDVTQSKQLEEQLQQAQKLEAIGRLAGGIAHDFNNVLGVIKGYAELLGEELGLGPKSRKHLEGIAKAADHAVLLTRQLLAFSRKQVLEPKVLNLNTVISEAVRILPRIIGEDIELRTKLSGDLGRAKVDPTQLEQVILNLVVNARDAMPHGGRLAIETSNCELDEAYASAHFVVQPGRYVLLSVSDTGTGMNQETLQHIFDPFFTTKPRDKGTGLGLATVYGIIKQSGGYIWVYSEPGQGTTFKIYLPRVEEAVEEAAPKPCAAGPPQGSETVLVVEDNESFRELISEFLRGFGYNVLAAGDSDTALRLSDGHEGNIDLLVTDVVLPKVTGPVLAKQLRSLRPALKVLFMSGYAEDAITDRGVLPSGTLLLQKPFARDALAHKIREALA